MNEKYVIPMMILIAGVFAGGGFMAGRQFQLTRTTGNFRGMMGNGQGFQTFNRNVQGMMRQSIRPIAGEIIAADDKSITVKMTDGSSKIVILSEKSVINKATEGSKQDLANGTKVSVFGTENPDGSLTATNIQIGEFLRVKTN